MFLIRNLVEFENLIKMERWRGKVAVVTGASSGIGAAIAMNLAKSGMITIGLARRTNLIEKLKIQLGSSSKNLFAFECDVSKPESIAAAFKWIEEQFKGVNVLINNAGIARFTSILEDDNSMNAVRQTIDTNLVGLIQCTKEAYRILKKTNDIGHIVNISSIAAYNVPLIAGQNMLMNIYPGSKHAVRATTEVIRQELINVKNFKVKISQISPGYVETEILEASGFPGKIEPALESQHIADACLYILGTPETVQIHDLIIKPVGELF